MKPYPYYQHKDINNLSELLKKSLENKDSIAFFYNDEDKHTIYKTYLDFYNDVNCLKKFIGNKYKNKNIAIVGENSYNWLVAFFGITLSNNLAVIIDKDLAEDDLLKLLKKSDVKCVFYSENYCEYLKNNIVCDKYTIENIGNYINDAKKIKDIEMVIDKDKPAVMFFTSGTTGANKGVLLSQRNITSDIVGACSLFKLSGNVLAVLPFHHSFGLITGILKPFNYGYPIFINSSLRNIMEEFKIAKPETIFVVPVFVETFYKQIWSNARKRNMDGKLKLAIGINKGLSTIGINLKKQLFKSILNEFGGNLKYIICGGAYLDKKYIEWFRSIGIEILNGYGITLDESLSEEAMDKALRPALMLVGEDKDVIPVRGPRNYKNGEYEYNFSVDGDLDCFEGKETIHKGKTKVYELKCHGGIIKR